MKVPAATAVSTTSFCMVTGCLPSSFEPQAAKESIEARIPRSEFPHENTDGPVVVLATLPNEPHGLGLEMVALYLATGGASPRVIGVSTPKEQIVLAAHAHQAAAVGLSLLASSDLLAAASDIRQLAPQLPRNTVLWLGGSGAANLPPIEGARIVSTWDDLDDVLRTLLTMGGRSP